MHLAFKICNKRCQFLQALDVTSGWKKVNLNTVNNEKYFPAKNIRFDTDITCITTWNVLIKQIQEEPTQKICKKRSADFYLYLARASPNYYCVKSFKSPITFWMTLNQSNILKAAKFPTCFKLWHMKNDLVRHQNFLKENLQCFFV